MPVEKKSKNTTPDIKNQIINNINLAATTEIKEESKENKNDTTIVSVRISENEKRSLKSFFDKEGITLSGGMLKCAKYVMEEVNMGNLRISADGGIKNRR